MLQPNNEQIDWKTENWILFCGPQDYEIEFNSETGEVRLHRIGGDWYPIDQRVGTC